MILAKDGGKPVRDTLLSYGKQWIDEEDINTVVEVLKGEYLTTGPYVDAFERKVADYVGASYAVAVNSGTAGLHIAMYGCGIKAGDEVLVTPMTFAASSNAILYMGAIPVFVDIDDRTYNIDVNKIKEKITSKTKAIVAVDFTGQPADLDEIREIVNKYNLKFIEDAAHALGSEYKHKRVGSYADATVFSFHPVKPITTAEGGMVTTNNKEIYNRMVMYRTHGIVRNKEFLLDKNQGKWYYEQQALGFNYRLTDIQAALGSSQMNKIDSFISRRREIASIYNEAFKDEEGIVLPFQKEDRQSGWHLYIIKLNLSKLKASRKEIFEALQAENIGVNVHYLPVYYHPYYHQMGYNKGICPVAEKVYNSIITLPLFPKMNQKDIQDVIYAVKKVLSYYKK